MEPEQSISDLQSSPKSCASYHPVPLPRSPAQRSCHNFISDPSRPDLAAFKPCLSLYLLAYMPLHYEPGALRSFAEWLSLFGRSQVRLSELAILSDPIFSVELLTVWSFGWRVFYLHLLPHSRAHPHSQIRHLHHILVFLSRGFELR